MPQGKIKTKGKLPVISRTKKKDKGPPVSKRRNAPIRPKSSKNIQVQKLKKLITKTVNATAEEQLRAIAVDGKKFLFGKQPGTESKKNR